MVMVHEIHDINHGMEHALRTFASPFLTYPIKLLGYNLPPTYASAKRPKSRSCHKRDCIKYGASIMPICWRTQFLESWDSCSTQTTQHFVVMIYAPFCCTEPQLIHTDGCFGNLWCLAEKELLQLAVKNKNHGICAQREHDRLIITWNSLHLSQ